MTFQDFFEANRSIEAEILQATKQHEDVALATMHALFELYKGADFSESNSVLVDTGNDVYVPGTGNSRYLRVKGTVTKAGQINAKVFEAATEEGVEKKIVVSNLTDDDPQLLASLEEAGLIRRENTVYNYEFVEGNAKELENLAANFEKLTPEQKQYLVTYKKSLKVSLGLQSGLPENSPLKGGLQEAIDQIDRATDAYEQETGEDTNQLDRIRDLIKIKEFYERQLKALEKIPDSL
jgi:hypothetical protein